MTDFDRYLESPQYKLPSELRLVLGKYKIENRLNNIYFSSDKCKDDNTFQVNISHQKKGQLITNLSSTLPIAQRSWTPFKSGDYRSNKYHISKEAVEEKLKSNTGKEKSYLEMILFQQKIHQQVGDVVISTKNLNKNKNRQDITKLNQLSFVLVGGGARMITGYSINAINRS